MVEVLAVVGLSLGLFLGGLAVLVAGCCGIGWWLSREERERFGNHRALWSPGAHTWLVDTAGAPKPVDKVIGTGAFDTARKVVRRHRGGRRAAA